MFEFNSDFTGKEKGYLVKNNYVNNGNLALMVMYWDDDYKCYEPYCTLTTNIIDLSDNMVALDINNSSSHNIIDILIDNDVLIPTGRVISSGFCNYPVCIVTDKLSDYLETPQDMVAE